MKLSLLVATRGRTEELRRLFRSLVAQTYRNFETIVVDQNEDNRVDPVVAEFRDSLDLRHIPSDSRGHASANNIGLDAADGDLIVIPDDDCWYLPDTFARLVAMFQKHPEWHGVTGREASSPDAPLNLRRFDPEAGQVTVANVWRRHISFTMIFRSRRIGDLRYDETLGVGAGTIWGSGEETDFLVRFILAGNYVQYDPAFVVCHPDWGAGPYSNAALRKAYAYGLGMGRVLNIHPFPPRVVCRCILRPFGGTVIAALTGKLNKAKYHWSIFRGRLGGWLASARISDAEASG
ncbi:MAG: glycosyltransferase family 2 protein [Acidobacteriota bacterium]|nr:glycosyltransferase family 2 protein [Acidobacteriota bacterium]